ncbi:hypothetical protein NUKP32_53650 [Klebsiella variicola]|nr:hypothetical protein NUKP32_53650 [Klebsiella variicola]
MWGISLEKIKHCRVIQSRADNALQYRVYLGQKTADTLAGLRCLCGKIITKAAEHGEFGDLHVSQLQCTLRVRQGTGGLGDDGRVTGIGFGFTGV